MPEQRKLERAALCYGLLALITLAVYLPAVEARFVTFDDTFYLTDNPKVQAGLTWDGVRWAFTHCHAANWHPLSWLSHMLDCQLYGLNPAGHHLTSVLLHAANTLLLFGLLRYLTGAFWRSAFVAALFALHPLHVESVAWVSERKDVLSTFFFLLTLWAYARYAGMSRVQSLESGVRPPLAAPQAARSTHHASLFYVLSLCLFALGLMSKPMLVTVPFVLLLLDYWPLKRMQNVECRMLRTPRSTLHALLPFIIEKLPFLVLSAAACVVTVIAQHKGGALASLEGGAAVSVESRLVNTPVSYAWYLAKLVWPSNLAVVYPYLRDWPPETVALSTALVAALTGVAVWQARRRAYVLVGWLWYLGTLVPVIGLVKVGVQSIADRYMYIPSIGLFVVLAWGVADLAAGWAHRTLALGAGAAGLLAACALAAGAQLRYWQDTESLFQHALAVTQNNYLAFNNLGLYFAQHGQWGLAKKYYRAALQIAPNYEAARNNLAAALVNDKHYPEGIAMLEEALRLNPQSADVESNLGAALYSEGKTREAIEHLRRAIQFNPEYALAHYNLGNALLKRDQAAEAAAEFRRAAELKPGYAEAHNNLALVLASQDKLDEAAAEFGQALALQPALLPAHYGLGRVLMEQGKLDEAAEAFSAALRIMPGDAEAQCGLAAALAGQHKAREAVLHYHEALKLQPDSPEALNNLAWILAANSDPQVRNGQEAVALAERACKLTDYQRPLMIGTLAAAYAEAGRFPEAMATAEKARRLAEQSDQLALAARNRELLELYRSGKPVRDNP